MIIVTDFGAVSGTAAVQTESIQRAIDHAAANGGGTVHFPAGTFLTGTLTLRTGITLHLDSGAILIGSSRIEDYPPAVDAFIDAVGQNRNTVLIRAVDCQNVGISGHGTIDGSGGSFAFEQDGRPFMIRFSRCKAVQVSGVTLRNSAGWVSHYSDCENVSIHDVTIRSTVNANNDGIDIDSCRNVRISHCDIVTGDDAICIKSTHSSPCENIVVTGCLLKSAWGAFKIGTESVGDIRNVVFSDSVIYETTGGGVKLISKDGAIVENILVSNVIMDRVSGPIFIHLGERKRTYYAGQTAREAGALRGVTLRNIRGTVWEEGEPLWGFPRRAGIFISGIPGHFIENVRMEGIDLSFPGGGTEEEANRFDVPERIVDYPEFPPFTPYPAWGFYVRHAKNVSLKDIRIQTQTADARSPIVCDDATLRSLQDVYSNDGRVTDVVSR